MISFHRRRESAPFLSPVPLRDLGGLRAFHSTLRQGLFRHFSRSGRRRALLPDYSPEGLRAPLLDAGLELAYYPVGPDLRLDRARLQAATRLFRPDVLVLIHPFGVYLEENAALARDLAGPGTLLVEDFAHSLPGSGVPITGDLALFAPYKTLGVADGGLLWFREGVPPSPGGYGPEDALSRELASRLSLGLALDDLFARLRPGPRLQTLARKSLGSRADAYALIARRYRDIDAPASADSVSILERVDFAAVHGRRRALARLYLAGLEPRFRLGPPEGAFLRQSLCSFPIWVDDQDRFHAHMARRGIQGCRLTDGWKPDCIEGRTALHRHHYLLPMGHHLADREIAEVIAMANRYPGYVGRHRDSGRILLGARPAFAAETRGAEPLPRAAAKD